MHEQKCAGVRRDGRPCTTIAHGPEGYCWHHDPANAQQRQHAASLAARAKARPSEITQVKTALKDIAERVASGRLEPGRGSVAAQAYGVYLRALELKRKIKETEELEERLEALEQETAEEQRRGAWLR